MFGVIRVFVQECCHARPSTVCSCPPFLLCHGRPLLLLASCRLPLDLRLHLRILRSPLGLHSWHNLHMLKKKGFTITASQFAVCLPIITAIIHAISTVSSISPPSISSISSGATLASSSPPAPSVLRRHLLDGESDSIDSRGAFLHQLLGRLLPVKGDKREVLWFIVLALVHGSHHLGHGAEGGKVCLDILIADTLGGQVAQVDLALLGLRLLAGDLLPLDDVRLLACSGAQTLHVLEQNEGESSGPAGVGVCLEIDVLDLSECSEVLLDVSVLGFLETVRVSLGKFRVFQVVVTCGRPPTKSFLSSS